MKTENETQMCTIDHSGNHRLYPTAGGWLECAGCGHFYGEAPKRNDTVATIRIEMDNGAFDDNPGRELARILHLLADKVARYGLREARIVDANGNAVGTFEITE